VVAEGDHVLISRGDHANAQGGTNCLRVIRVGDQVC
jgi:pyruvate kinase